MGMSVTLIDGRPSDTVSVHDRGFQYGDGLFETMAVKNAAPLLWDRHMQRLKRGATRLGIILPDAQLMREEAEFVCRGTDRGVLKIILTRGLSGRGYAPINASNTTRIVNLMPWPDYPNTHHSQGIAAQFCHITITRQPDLAGIKHLNRLEQVMARRELAADSTEGLMLDERGHVIEGTMTNIFIVRQDALFTPDLSYSGVEGVMRSLVLDRVSELPMATSVTELTKADIQEADEIFLTNSLIGLWPIRRLASREYPIGKHTRRIQEVIRDACCVD
jgi:4-amino-4-deoxychorismate lyase